MFLCLRAHAEYSDAPFLIKVSVHKRQVRRPIAPLHFAQVKQLFSVSQYYSHFLTGC